MAQPTMKNFAHRLLRDPSRTKTAMVVAALLVESLGMFLVMLAITLK